MSDKELLELAAKAVGYDISHPMNAERQEMIPPVMGFVTYLDGKLQSTLWNPLDDDGQALRLAVKLYLEIAPACYSQDCVDVYSKDDNPLSELFNGDPYAATRRAIVRTAAAIGEKM